MSDGLDRVLDELRDLRQEVAAQRADFAGLREVVESMRRRDEHDPYARDATCADRHERSNKLGHSADEKASRIGKEIQRERERVNMLVGTKDQPGSVPELERRVTRLEMGALKLLLAIAAASASGAALVRYVLP